MNDPASRRFAREVRRWGPARPAGPSPWAAWAGRLRDGRGRRHGPYRLPRAVFGRPGGGGVPGSAGPAGPPGPAGVPAERVLLGPFRFVPARGAPPAARRAERPVPPTVAVLRSVVNLTRPERTVVVQRSGATVVRETVAARGGVAERVVPGSAPQRVFPVAAVAAPGRTVTVVRDRPPTLPRIVHAAVVQRLPATIRGAVELTRRVVEERTRREVRAVVGPAPRHRAAPATAAPAPATPPPQPGTRAGTDGGFAGAGGTGGPAPPPAIDVDRLTDQIVRRIDDRITAFRERLGRPF